MQPREVMEGFRGGWEFPGGEKLKKEQEDHRRALRKENYGGIGYRNRGGGERLF